MDKKEQIHVRYENIFRISFRQEYRKEEDPAAMLSVYISNKDLNPIKFITEVDMESFKQVAYVA